MSKRTNWKGETMEEVKTQLAELGFTNEEIYAFLSSVECANRVLALPEIHPMDTQEFCSAFHVIQDKILARIAVAKIRGAAR